MNIVAYSLKARTVETQQPAVTKHGSVNNNRGMMFPGRSVPMATHATMEYVMPLLSSNRTATEERRFMGSVQRCYKQDSESMECQLVGEWASELDNRCGSVVVSCCCEKLVTEARGQLGNPEEGERLPLEAVTRKLVTTQLAEKT
jgi:hypothetical protein